MLVNALATQVSTVLSLSGFLTSDGPPGRRIVGLVDAGLFLLTAAFASLIIDRFGRAALIRRLLVGFTPGPSCGEGAPVAAIGVRAWPRRGRVGLRSAVDVIRRG